MVDIFVYLGGLGSGKTYSALQALKQARVGSTTCLMLSFASPLKDLARTLGFDKNTINDDGIVRDFKDIEIDISKALFRYALDNFYSNFDEKQTHLVSEQLVSLRGLKFHLLENYSKSTSEATRLQLKKEIQKLDREALQKIGTEYGREALDVNVWANIATLKVHSFAAVFPSAHIYIDDVRFLNEAMALMKLESNNICVHFINVIADNATRAYRLDISEKELEAMCQHRSELEIEKTLDYVRQNARHYSEIVNN